VGLTAAGRLWGEKSVGGGGVVLVMDDISSSLYRSILARTELGVESERRQLAHSTSCVAAMVCISTS
jgi:hypothetical protein